MSIDEPENLVREAIVVRSQKRESIKRAIMAAERGNDDLLDKLAPDIVRVRKAEEVEARDCVDWVCTRSGLKRTGLLAQTDKVDPQYTAPGDLVRYRTQFGPDHWGYVESTADNFQKIRVQSKFGVEGDVFEHNIALVLPGYGGEDLEIRRQRS